MAEIELTPEEANEAGLPHSQDVEVSPDELGEGNTPSRAGAFARRAANEVVPGAAGGVAGMSLVYPAAAAGTALGGPIGGLAGGALGAITGGIAGGMAGKYLQDKLLEAIGAKQGTGMFSESQENADKFRYPNTSFAGELVGGTLPSFGVGRVAAPAARAIGGALQGGIEAGQEAYNGEDLSGAKIGMSALAGATAYKPRAWMNPITGPLERKFPLGGKPTPKVVENVEMAPDIEHALRPDATIEPDTASAVMSGAPSDEVAHIRRMAEKPPGGMAEPPPPAPNTQFPDYITSQQTRLEELRRWQSAAGPETKPHWDEAVAQTEANISEWKERIGSGVEAPEAPPFTPKDSDVTSTPPMQSIGTSPTPPPPIQNPATGNQNKAPMRRPVASKPNSPDRNYTKGSDTGGLPVELGKPKGAKVKNFKVGELPDDVHAAMAAAQPEVTGAVTPPAAQAAIEGKRPLSLNRSIAANFTPATMKLRRPMPAREAPPAEPAHTMQQLRGEVGAQYMHAYDAGYNNPRQPRPVTYSSAEGAAHDRGLEDASRDRIAVIRRKQAEGVVPKPAEPPKPRVLERVLTAEEQKAVNKASKIAPETRANQLPDLPADLKVAAAEATLSSEKKTKDNARRDTNRLHNDIGAIVNKENLPRHNSVIGAVRGAVAEMKSREAEGHGLVPEGTTVEDNKARILAHAKALYEDAERLHGGKDPIDRTSGYEADPEIRPPEWNIVQQARRLTMKTFMGNSEDARKARMEYITRLENGGEYSKDYEREASRDQRTAEFDDANPDHVRAGGHTTETQEPIPLKGSSGFKELAERINNFDTDQWEAASEAFGGDFKGEIAKAYKTNTPSRLGNQLDDLFEKGLMPRLKAPGENAGAILEGDKQAIRDIISKLPPAIRVQLGGAHKDGFFGSFSPTTNTVRVLDAAFNEGMGLPVLRHEVIHALKSLGLFKPHEWTILERAGVKLSEQTEAHYREHFSKDDYPAHILEEKIREEGVARLAESYSAGNKEIKPIVARLLERLKEFFEKLGNALRAMDPKAFESVKSIMAKVESGEVGARYKDPRKPWEQAHDELMEDAYPEEHKQMADEIEGITGGGNISPRLKDWLTDLQTAWHNKGAVVAQDMVDYAKGIARTFATNQYETTLFKRRLFQHLLNSKLPDGTYPTKDQYKEIQRAVQRQGGVNALPAELKDFANSALMSMKREYETKYDSAKFIKTELKLPGYDIMPDHTIKSDVGDEWFPRYQVGDTAFESGQKMDVITGRSLHAASDTTKERGYFTLHNAKTDERLVFAPQEGNKEIHILRGGAPQKMLIKGGIDPTKINTVIPLKVKGVTSDWVVTHAHPEEITLAAGKDVNGKNKVEYHDPMIAMANALHGITKELENAKSLQKLMKDQRFIDNSYGKNPGNEKITLHNLRKTELAPFKNQYFPQQIAWTLDDYHANGFFSDNEFKKALNDLSANSAKIFYFFGPLVHVGNEFNKWAVGRGWDWLKPNGWKSFVMDGAAAYKDSRSTNRPLEREMYEAGANLMYPHSVTSRFLERVGRELGVSMGKDPSKWDPVAKAFGITTKELGNSAYDKSTGSMWWLTDLMAKQSYLEGKRKGLSNEDAATRMHHFVDSYQMPNVLWGAGKGGTLEASGRFMKQLLTDPSLSLFGPYHWGVFHSLAHMTGNFVGPNATRAQRIEAAGQFAVAAAMMYAVYPLLSAGYQQITGNPHSEVEARGMTRVVNTGRDVITGKKNFADAGRNAFTPSVGLDTAERISSGKSWTGKDIITKKDYTKHPIKGLTRTAGEAGEFAAGQFVSPYKTVSNAIQRPGSDPLTVIGHFAESMLGLKTPTPGTIKHEANAWKDQMKEEKAHNKRPGGQIERGFNAAARSM